MRSAFVGRLEARSRAWWAARERAAPAWLRRSARFLAALWRESRDDRVTGLAAEIAYYAVFSVFPGLIVLVAGLGWLGSLLGEEVAGDAERFVVDLLGRVLTDQAGGLVGEVRSLFAESRGGLVTFATLVAVWGLSRGFAAVIRALDLAYYADERRSLLKQRLLALLMALGSAVMAVVVLAMIVIGPLLGLEDLFARWGLARVVDVTWTWVRWPVMFVLLVLWAATVYHLAPHRRSPWRADLPGAVLAAVLWLLVSVGLSVYVRVAALGNAVLGTLGGGLVLLLWLWLLGLALLVGGEVNAILREKRGDKV